jgi:hypothetical protein
MFFSPFVIPLGAFVVAIVAIVSGIVSQMHARRTKADQRMALLARGVPIAEIEAILKSSSEHEERPVKDPMRSLGNARRAAVVLISSGLGIITFLVLVSYIVQERDVLAGAAVGVIPLLIGVGFVVDYQLQKREMSRFGLEVGS